MRAGALIVGIREYKDPNWNDLRAPVKDACRFARLLTEKGAAPPGAITLCLSPASDANGIAPPGARVTGARRHEIQDALTDLVENVKPEILYVFWSGHGMIESGRRRLFSSDARLKDGQNFDLENLREFLRSNHCSAPGALAQQYIFVDACANLSRVGRGTGVLFPPCCLPPTESIIRGREQFVLMASTAEEYAYELPDQEAGAFTDALCRVLEGEQNSFPPAPTWLMEEVEKRFQGYAGQLRSQRPVYLHLEDYRGNKRIVSIHGSDTRFCRLPRPNPFFVGRDEELKELAQGFSSEREGTIPYIAIVGGGGEGKTQTAVQYAHRYQGRYDTVLWARADTLPALRSSFVKLAQELKLPNLAGQSRDAIIRRVRDWLHTERGWLLILDNVSQPEKIRPLLPEGGEGHVLLTTRTTTLGRLGKVARIFLGPLPLSDAKTFLLDRSQLTSRQGLSKAQETQAKELAEELGCLPLALECAAAYIETTGATLKGYLDKYRKAASFSRDDENPREIVARAWDVSFQEIGSDFPREARLYTMSVFFGEGGIPFELLTRGVPRLLASDPSSDPLAVEESLAPLRQRSLLLVHSEAKVYVIHRMFREAARLRLLGTDKEAGTRRVATERRRALRCLARAFPFPTFDNWPLCERLLPHALEATVQLAKQSNSTASSANLFYNLGVYHRRRAEYEAAGQSLQRALNLREMLLPPHHPDIARVHHALADLYREQGRYEEAKESYDAAILIWKNLDEPTKNDPESLSGYAWSLHNLALLHYRIGRYSEAKPPYGEALAIRKRALGKEAFEVCQSFADIAALYRDLGRLRPAERFFARSLQILRKLQGSGSVVKDPHPQTAFLRHNLAELHLRDGRLDEAAQGLLVAMRIRRRWYGKSHPHVGGTIHAWGHLCLARGETQRAIRRFEKALRIWAHAFGPGHHDLAWAYRGLGLAWEQKGSFDEAGRYFQAALEIREKLTPQHEIVLQLRADVERTRSGNRHALPTPSEA